jgi:hypothetical protein
METRVTSPIVSPISANNSTIGIYPAGQGSNICITGKFALLNRNMLFR